jgi:hypothetical protein
MLILQIVILFFEKAKFIQAPSARPNSFFLIDFAQKGSHF